MALPLDDINSNCLLALVLLSFPGVAGITGIQIPVVYCMCVPCIKTQNNYYYCIKYICKSWQGLKFQHTNTGLMENLSELIHHCKWSFMGLDLGIFICSFPIVIQIPIKSQSITIFKCLIPDIIWAQDETDHFEAANKKVFNLQNNFSSPVSLIFLKETNRYLAFLYFSSHISGESQHKVWREKKHQQKLHAFIIAQ